MSFSENLRYYRKQKKISQRKLATELGLSPSLIAMYETDLRKPSFEVLCSLSHYFKIPLNDLVSDSSTEILVEASKAVTLPKVFESLLDLAGFNESLDDDANVTIYNEHITVNQTPELIERVMKQVIAYFTFLLSQEQ